MKRAFLLCTVPLALAACGTISLGRVPIDDVNLTAPAPLTPSGQTLYLSDSLFKQPTPGGVNRLVIQGDLSVSGSNTSRTLEFFIRPTRPDCPGRLNYLLCPDTAGGTSLGTVTVQGASSAPLRLSGAALDAAGKAGQGYLGVRLIQGTVNAGDSIIAAHLLARPYF